MKYIRTIIMILILAQASSLALAAVCATSCASQVIMSSLHFDDMSGMKNCHKSSMKKDISSSNAEQKSCTIGAGCHFTQSTSPTAPSTKIKLVDAHSITFPKFVPSAISIDLSPPLKPPA